MARWLSITGIALTLGYLLALGFILNGRVTEILVLAPNEIGDLLAGMFGPLAIIWLVLGFFQQSVELKQNTRALELQAKELGNSVEQHREMVLITKQQLEVVRRQFETDLEALRHEQKIQKEAALPRFVIHPSSVSQYGSKHIVYATNIENMGNFATDVAFIPSSERVSVSPSSLSSFPHGTKQKFQWRVEEPEENKCWLMIRYKDALGAIGEQVFYFVKSETNAFTGMLVPKTTAKEA